MVVSVVTDIPEVAGMSKNEARDFFEAHLGFPVAGEFMPLYFDRDSQGLWHPKALRWERMRECFEASGAMDALESYRSLKDEAPEEAKKSLAQALRLVAGIIVSLRY